jgi:hypothetical protein
MQLLELLDVRVTRSVTCCSSAPRSRRDLTDDAFIYRWADDVPLL